MLMQEVCSPKQKNISHLKQNGQTYLTQDAKNVNKQVGSDQQLSLMIPPKPDLLLVAQECVFIFVCDLL